MRNKDGWCDNTTSSRAEVCRFGKHGGQPQMSQRSRILEMLRYARREHGAVELDEIVDSGCFKIEARIGELRRRGFVIEKAVLRRGDGRFCSSYFLTFDPERDQNAR